MARITVEDCLENVDNRFELVMIGSKRARQLAVEGRTALVPEENDKPTDEGAPNEYSQVINIINEVITDHTELEHSVVVVDGQIVFNDIEC